MYINITRAVKAALLVSSLLSVSTLANAEELLMQIDRTQLVTLSSVPAMIVVGNPAIADATANGNQIFINAFSSGSTNIVMMDAAGSPIATLDVTVTQDGSRSASLFKNGQRQTVVCVDYCDPTMQVGDGQDYFRDVASQYQAKRKAALGILESSSGAAVSAPNGNGGGGGGGAAPQ
jgi:hypothetical protein